MAMVNYKLITAFAVFAFAVSCHDREIMFRKTGISPSAEGKAILSQGDDDDCMIEVRVEHLVDPGRLHPEKTAYVLWVKNTDKDITNLGHIVIDDKGSGEITAVTSYEQFYLFISAEDGPDVSDPGAYIVLRTDIVFAS